MFILYIFVFYTFTSLSESKSNANQLLHPTNILTDFNLLRATAKWFEMNENKLIYLKEKDLRKKFIKFIDENKIPYKRSKELSKAFVYLKNIQKQKAFILSKYSPLIPNKIWI